MLQFLAAFTFHWKFQFGVRSILLLVGTFTVVCGVLTIELRRARTQRTSIESIGGAVFVHYNWQVDSAGLPVREGRPPAPEWLRNLLGDDFFGDVVMLYLYKTKLSDAEMKCLNGMPYLESLELSDTLVTDAGLRSVQGLVRLKSLTLNNTRITDVGLENLTGLPKLRSLSLASTRITDAALAHLDEFKHLDALNLSDTEITDFGLESLYRLPQLHVLYLGGTAVTDAGVAKLQKELPNCKISR